MCSTKFKVVHSMLPGNPITVLDLEPGPRLLRTKRLFFQDAPE